MLTKNRREVLKKRGSLEPRERAVYDYRLLQWLETMLNSSQEGGIGDINRVLDTLDRDAIRKHLKDENVEDLLKLIERLLDIMDFMPVGFTPKEVEYQGKMIKTNTYYVEKSIMVAPQDLSGEVSILATVKEANEEDKNRHRMLKTHIDQIKYFIEPGTHMPEIRSAEYFKVQINSAHEQGLIALAYDVRQPTKEEELLNAIDTAARLGHPVPPEEQISELREAVAKQRSDQQEEPPK